MIKRKPECKASGLFLSAMLMRIRGLICIAPRGMNSVIQELRGNIMAELNNSIIKWINELPDSDQEIIARMDKVDMEMELLIDLLKEGRDIKRLRELYRKISDDLDQAEQLD
jgi:hypothetical protein